MTCVPAVSCAARRRHTRRRVCPSHPRPAVDILPEKPNRITPAQNPDPKAVTSASTMLKSLSCLKDTDKQPHERFALPVTGNMEYGFFATRPLVPTNPMFDYKTRTCDVVRAAAARGLASRVPRRPSRNEVHSQANRLVARCAVRCAAPPLPRAGRVRQQLCQQLGAQPVCPGRRREQVTTTRRYATG